jgi:hypothetical protein
MKHARVGDARGRGGRATGVGKRKWAVGITSTVVLEHALQLISRRIGAPDPGRVLHHVLLEFTRRTGAGLVGIHVVAARGGALHDILVDEPRVPDTE